MHPPPWFELFLSPNISITWGARRHKTRVARVAVMRSPGRARGRGSRSFGDRATLCPPLDRVTSSLSVSQNVLYLRIAAHRRQISYTTPPHIAQSSGRGANRRLLVGC